MAMLVTCCIPHFGPHSILTAAGQISMTFCTDSHDQQRIIPHYFGDALNFAQQHNKLWVKIAKWSLCCLSLQSPSYYEVYWVPQINVSTTKGSLTAEKLKYPSNPNPLDPLGCLTGLCHGVHYSIYPLSASSISSPVAFAWFRSFKFCWSFPPHACYPDVVACFYQNGDKLLVFWKWKNSWRSRRPHAHQPFSLNYLLMISSLPKWWAD